MATIISDPYHPWFASEIASIRQSNSLPSLIACLGSGNGYLREAAIARSVELAAPELLPAISARLNDWVPAATRRPYRMGTAFERQLASGGPEAIVAGIHSTTINEVRAPRACPKGRYCGDGAG